MNLELKNLLSEYSDVVYEKMDDLLPTEQKGRVGENRIARAMRYSALSEGKRLRPFLVMSSSDLFGVSQSSSSQVGAAIEFLHSYSLIHDDLPAMDDDDIRRGKASCHIEFDEATAILAGDALLTLSFEVLASDYTHDDARVRSDLVQAFGRAAGTKGLVGGQMIDLLSEDRNFNVEEITRLQRMKTGALFVLACEAGAILGKAPQKMRNALRGYANDVGLAFQITDDILDVEEESREDKNIEKGTYVNIMGLEKASKQVEILVDQAIEHLDVFDSRADHLRYLAKYIINRNI